VEKAEFKGIERVNEGERLEFSAILSMAPAYPSLNHFIFEEGLTTRKDF